MITKLMFSSLLAFTLAVPATFAKEERDTGKESERALRAANVLKEVLNAPESVPKDLLSLSQGIAVIPNVTKGAFGVGGRFGKGVVSKRKSDGTWGAPSFIEVSGGSFGFQIGVSVTDVILVFTQRDGLKGLLEDKLELGGDAGVAAGPVGRSAEVGTNITFDSPIYSYSRSKGLFAGLAFKGTVMSIDDSANHRVYGQGVSGTDILVAGKVPVTAEVRPFVDALNQRVGISERKTQISSSSPGHPTAEHSSEHQPSKTEGVKAIDIKQAQEALQTKGFYKGTVDGVLGPKTRQAIRDYQAAENIKVTGALDSETARKLGVLD